jgi:type II secretory pathway component PulK
MRIELLPGMTNVVRFPVERRARPTLSLLRDIAPDVREVMSLAEAFGMEMPAPDLRGRTDATTAEHIATSAPAAHAELEAFLAELEGIPVRRAISACRDAHDASLAGSFWTEPLEEKAEARTDRAAALLLAAHAQAEQAEGVARAVALARQREPWAPRDSVAEMEFLLAVHRATG